MRHHTLATIHSIGRKRSSLGSSRNIVLCMDFVTRAIQISIGVVGRSLCHIHTGTSKIALRS
jgi:hypothetical protein